MVTLLSGLFFIICFAAAAYLIGCFYLYYFKSENNTVAFSITVGFIFMLSIFEMLCVPMMYQKLPLHTLAFTWFVIVLIFCACGIFYKIKNKKPASATVSVKSRTANSIPPLLWIAIALIILQAFISAYYIHIDDDDALYVATANTSVYTDTIFEYDAYTGEIYDDFPLRYAFSLFPVFCSLFSFFTGIPAAVMMHTVLPALFIPIAYLVYYCIGTAVFHGDKKKTALFLLFLCILNIWGNTSVYTTSSFLLFRIWQGKAVLANILLPAIFLQMFLILNENKLKIGNWILLLLTVFASCAATSMGLALAPLTVCLFSIVDLINKRDIKRFIKLLLCCSPALLYGLIYVFIRGKVFMG